MTYSKTLEETILDLMKPGVPVSPSDLVDHIKRGKYPSQFIHHMKMKGYSISTVKNGRNIVSYTLNSDTPAQLTIISSENEDIPTNPSESSFDKASIIDPDWDKFDYNHIKNAI